MRLQRRFRTLRQAKLDFQLGWLPLGISLHAAKTSVHVERS
jgi:hypothetical protein